MSANYSLGKLTIFHQYLTFQVLKIFPILFSQHFRVATTHHSRHIHRARRRPERQNVPVRERQQRVHSQHRQPTGLRRLHGALAPGPRGQVRALGLLHRLGRSDGQGAHLGHHQQGAHTQERVSAPVRVCQGPAVVQRQSANCGGGRGTREVRPCVQRGHGHECGRDHGHLEADQLG